ncbi:MAG: 2'-5' RNA ligase [Acidobacteria bacterium RIFCSPLOWO2_12_FULL_54_10]|nr:MAG: 2'-5' RNA ligase [Acidobacteria bacterium RIFCSPLOWO2_12_FULL_54_10]
MRLFIAIDLPEEIRSKISDLLDQLKPMTRNVRWSRPETMHITLKFLGETSPDIMRSVSNRLSTLTNSLPFHLRIQGAGYFPSEVSPNIIWLGIEAGPPLETLANKIEACLVPLGFQKETRPFSPHLTLGRLRSKDSIPVVRQFLSDPDRTNFGSGFEVREFHLYESQLSPGGSVYHKIARFPLVSTSK